MSRTFHSPPLMSMVLKTGSMVLTVAFACVMGAPSVFAQQEAPAAPSSPLPPPVPAEAVPVPTPTPAPAPMPAPSAAPLSANEALLKEIQALRQEVAETRQLKAQMNDLQNELATLRATNAAPRAPALPPGDAMGEAPSGEAPAGTEQPRSTGEARTRGGAAAPATPPSDDFPLKASYRYHDDAAGPLGGGGYTHLGTDDDEFTVNLTSTIAVDGSFYDRANVPTTFQGFFPSFNRSFLYGNITKNWLYQIGTQEFAGEFNLLDFWMAYRFGDRLTVRFGKGLTPPLYEYYAFLPSLETTISNSPLFQMAGRRQIGVMATGNLFNGRFQYWSGITNPGIGFFAAPNRNMQYNGAFTFTPFKGMGNRLLDGMGAGIGISIGEERFALQQNGIAFLNGAGEPTPGNAWVNAQGIPFAEYNKNVVADGVMSRWSPHFFWYGRMSVVAEMMNMSRMLSDGTTKGRSTSWGYYVDLSYWLTGERDFSGNGFQGFSTTDPIRPFRPSQGQYGIGAWQIAAQWSQLNIGRGDFNRGFINPTTWTNNLDELMVGVNWWPNKYTRISCDWVWSYFNNPIPLTGPNPIQQINSAWMRFAMYF